MSISPLISFNKTADQVFAWSLNGKGFVGRRVGNFFNRQFDKAVNDPARFAASMLVTSIVSKDVVGCVLYTYQSLHNDKIPEDKRKSVAALDLMNGGLMVGGQLLVGKIIDKKMTPKMFGKMYSGKFKDKDTKKETLLKGLGEKDKACLYQDNILDTVRKEIKCQKGIDAKKVADAIVKEVGHSSNRYKLIEAGFGLIVTALATTALVKRTLVPLIATPLSAWYKTKFMDKPSDKKIEAKPEDKFERVTATTYTPWAYNSNNTKSDLVQDQFKKTTPKQA